MAWLVVTAFMRFIQHKPTQPDESGYYKLMLSVAVDSGLNKGRLLTRAIRRASMTRE